MAALMEIMEALSNMPQENLAEGYAEQLRIIEASLAQVEDAQSRAAIEDLKRDLTELMELTKSTVEQTTEDILAAEEKRFRAELAMLEESSSSSASSSNDDEEKVLDVAEGNIYQAPHEHTWGSIAYHNAIVSSVEARENETYVRVFFTNPTHREMLPCNFYLDGDCRFDEENCHFSHGELVKASLLREYKAPEFGRLKKNCLVLAKLDDKLWRRGHVVSADFVKKSCCVQLDADYKGTRERDFEFENLLPIFNEEQGEEDDTSDDSSESESEQVDDTNDCQTSGEEFNENIMEIHTKQPLGEWEKHTRGIGSKLMMKMGYIPGNGLGSRGKGITVPISAQVLPQGCSLDTCMKLRERANGDKDLFSVERKLKSEQKKQELLNAKAYERESKRTDVFSFLNEAVLKTQQTATQPRKSLNAMQQQTTKSLNVAQMQISDDIRRKSREINQMQESFKRQSSGTENYKRLQAQINIKNQELQQLKREERNLSKEQTARKTTEKLVVF